jgi:hypothetical protein
MGLGVRDGTLREGQAKSDGDPPETRNLTGKPYENRAKRSLYTMTLRLTKSKSMRLSDTNGRYGIDQRRLGREREPAMSTLADKVDTYSGRAE